MHARLLILVLCAGWVYAGGDSLERENEALKQRVRELERTALAEDVNEYLQEHEGSAEGGSPLHPGALTLKVTGEIRIREEYNDRLYTPMDPDGALSFDFAHMRTRLRFDVGVLDNLDVVIEFQDVRKLGEEESTTADTEGVDIKRAKIVFKQVGGRPIDVEVGRFVMYYGSQRLIGHLEWVDQGRTYDGLRGKIKTDDFWLDFFGVRVRETMTPDDDQWFVGVYGGRNWFEAYALVFGDDMPMAGEISSDDTLFVTLGFRIARTEGQWDYTLEIAFQTGDTKGDDLSAWAAAITLGYTFEDATWKPRVGLEVAFASGDEDPTDGDSEQFQTLFPTNHLHYGDADLIGWSNIIDIEFGVKLHPREDVIVIVEAHHFIRPEDAGAWVNAGGAMIRPGLATADSHLGNEIDLRIVWKPTKPLSFLFGYAVFLPGDFVNDTGDDPVSHFFYLQTRVKF